MIKVYPYNELGAANHGWLDTHFHFSFADYYNPDRVNFGALRVINDDTVKAGSGFDMHKHRDMEIITFVRKGAITHRDSRGNEGRTKAGDVQVMSAGTGIFHSEFNLESEDTTLFQIWIFPKEKGIAPDWDQAEFANRQVGETLPLLVSGRAEDTGKGALYIHQDASIHGGTMTAGQIITQTVKDQAYIVISSGEVAVDGQTVRAGDGVEITDQKSIEIKAINNAEVIFIDVPA